MLAYFGVQINERQCGSDVSNAICACANPPSHVHGVMQKASKGAGGKRKAEAAPSATEDGPTKKRRPAAVRAPSGARPGDRLGGVMGFRVLAMQGFASFVRVSAHGSRSASLHGLWEGDGSWESYDHTMSVQSGALKVPW